MAKELKRLLTFVIALALCATCTPTAGIAEELQNTNDQDEGMPVLMYRLHAQGEADLLEDDPWYMYDADSQESTAFEQELDFAPEEEALPNATQDAEAAYDETLAVASDEATLPALDNMPAADENANESMATQDDQEEQPSDGEDAAQQTNDGACLDGVQLKLSDGFAGVLYRVRTLDGSWPETWEHDGTYVFAENGISAIQIRLSEELEAEYDVWYRACTKTGEWLGWACNGEDAGSSSELLASLQTVIVKKGEDAPQGSQLPAYKTDAEETPSQADEPSVTEEVSEEAELETSESVAVQDVEVIEEKSSNKTTTNKNTLKTQASTTTPYVAYRTRMRAEKWSKWAKNGATSGGVDSGRRMEGVRLKLKGTDGGIAYKVCLQNKKWSQGWVRNGKVAGMPGKEMRIEAIRIRLTGAAKRQYDVYYRAYVPFIGWMGWASNGAVAGSTGFSYRMEGLQVVLVKKGSPAPSNADAVTPIPCFGKMTVSYAANLKNGGWQPEVKNGAVTGVASKKARVQQLSANLPLGNGIRYATCTNAGSYSKWQYDGAIAGTSGSSLTSVRFQLYGALKSHYNIWYRTYVAGKGWLGWTKNGKKAGSDSAQNPIGAIQIKVLRKSAKAPGKTLRAYAITKQLNGVDVYGGDYSLGFNAKTVTADFVIIKATQGYGDIYYSPKNGYKKLANDALAAGKLIGFYHYAEGRDAKKEAKYFYDAIKEYKGRAIACLDWEGYGPSNPNNPYFGSGIDVTWCNTFLTELQRLFGGTPFLYTGKNETNTYNWSSVAKKFPLWGAEYAYEDYVYQGYETNPWQSSRPWGAWGSKPTIFQYGAVNPKPNNGGVNNLDADVFYGTPSDWKAYCG